MTLREQVGQLVSCLERSAAEMSELGAKMKEQRKAFASLRGSELQAAVDSLRGLADRARAHDKEREAIAARLEEILQIGKPFEVSRILPHLPKDLAGKLDDARNLAKKAALDLRTEAAVGARLLEFSAGIQEMLMQRFLKLQEVETRGYDRHARLTKNDQTSGRLVKGVL